MRRSSIGFWMAGLCVGVACIEFFLPPIRRVYDIFGGFDLGIAAMILFDAFSMRSRGE